MLTTFSQFTPESMATAGQRWGDTAVSPPQPLINTYASISLGEMADVALLNRTDNKFVLPTSSLLSALRPLHQVYRVLEVDGVRLHHYQTLYFDTAEVKIYYDDPQKAESAIAWLEAELAGFRGNGNSNLP